MRLIGIGIIINSFVIVGYHHMMKWGDRLLDMFRVDPIRSLETRVELDDHAKAQRLQEAFLTIVHELGSIIESVEGQQRPPCQYDAQWVNRHFAKGEFPSVGEFAITGYSHRDGQDGYWSIEIRGNLEDRVSTPVLMKVSNRPCTEKPTLLIVLATSEQTVNRTTDRRTDRRRNIRKRCGAGESMRASIELDGETWELLAVPSLALFDAPVRYTARGEVRSGDPACARTIGELVLGFDLATQMLLLKEALSRCEIDR